MLYEATNVIPSVLTKSGAVDANDYISVSFQMSGTSKLYGVLLRIRSLDDDSVDVLTNPMIAPDNTYATDENGNPVRYSYTSPYYKWSTYGCVNGKSYSYSVQLLWYDGNVLRSVSSQSEEVIYTRTPPVVALGYTEIKSPKKILTATFSQAEGDTVALARWVVCQYGKEDSPILDTGAIPTQVLSHTCNFFRDGKKYGIRLFITTSTGYEYDSGWTWITADFTDVTEQSSQIDIACAKGYGTDIQFEKPAECEGVVSGDVSIETDVINAQASLTQGCVSIGDSSSVTYQPEQEIESPKIFIRQKAFTNYADYPNDKVLLGSNAFCATSELIFYIENNPNPTLVIKSINPSDVGSPNYAEYDTIPLQGFVKGNYTYSVVNVSNMDIMASGGMVLLYGHYDTIRSGSSYRDNGVLYWVYDKSSPSYGTWGVQQVTGSPLKVPKSGNETYVYCGKYYATRNGSTLSPFNSITFSGGSYISTIYNMAFNPNASGWAGGPTAIINGNLYMMMNGTTFVYSSVVDANLASEAYEPVYSPDGYWFITNTGIYKHSGTSHTLKQSIANIGAVFSPTSDVCLILNETKAEIYILDEDDDDKWKKKEEFTITLNDTNYLAWLGSMANNRFFVSNIAGDVQNKSYLEAFQVLAYPYGSSMTIKTRKGTTEYTATKISQPSANDGEEYYFVYEFDIANDSYKIYKYIKTSTPPYSAYISTTTGTLSLPTDSELVEIKINGRAYVTGLAVMEILEEEAIRTNPFYPPDWGDGNDYLLLALYNENTDAGVVSSDYGGILIYRTDTEGNDYKIVAESDANAWHSRDYSLQSGKQYKYGAYVLDGSNMLSRIYASDVVVGMLFKRHTLLVTEIMEDGCYHVRREYYFDGNLSEGNVSNNNSPTILQNFTRYPSISKSHANYESGTLTALIGNVSRYGQYNECLALLNELKELSRQKYTLFLRDMKGTIKMVAISSPQTYSRNLGNALMQTTLSLPWTEIGDAEKEKVIMTDDDDIATFDLVNSPLNIAKNGWGENHG